MSKPHQNHIDPFIELRHQSLYEYARDWVDKYKSIQIERVVLYRYNTDLYALIKSIAKGRTDELSKSVYKGSHPVQYAIVFEISNCIETLKRYPQDYLDYPPNIEYVSEEAAKGTPIENLLPIPEDPQDIACIEFLKDCKQAYGYDGYNRPHPFLNPAFRNRVFKGGAKKDFKKEWDFFYKRPNDHLNPNILTDEPHLILYPVSDVSGVLQASKITEIIEQHETYLKDYKNVFFRTGKNWFIKYRGESTTLPDYKKIRYIVHLLDNPDKPIHVRDLFYAVKKQDLNDLAEEYIKGTQGGFVDSENRRIDLGNYIHHQMEGGDDDKDGLDLSDLAVEELSVEDKENFQNLGYELLQRINEAGQQKNSVGIKKAKEDLERYKKYMFNEYGIRVLFTRQGIKFKIHKRPGVENERARKNVRNQIVNARKDFKEEIPELYEHLVNQIHTGLECTYRTDEHHPTDWFIKY